MEKRSKKLKLRLEFVEIKKTRKFDKHFAAYFDIYNDGSSLVKNIMLKLELPSGITAAETGKGWIVKSIENNKRYGVAELMGEDHFISPNSKHNPIIFGLFIPEDKYTKGSKITLNYQLSAEGMPITEGVVSNEL